MNSKIQHKNYEKGEFTDKRDRNLSETIQLINTFSWDKERKLTLIQLTGPSVTIIDAHGNYLKAGLYFNSKYCLYYLDKGNHLYEYHTGDIEAVNQMVTDFFNSTINLSLFEKHLVNIGNRAHFETCNFEYQIRPWRTFMLTAMMLVYLFFFIIMDIIVVIKRGLGPFSIVLALTTLLICYIICKIYYSAFVKRNNYLQISRGSAFFSFGYTADTVKDYQKDNIKQIIVDQHSGSKNPNVIDGFEIVFKNGETINFNTLLISSAVFRSKFEDNMGNTTITYVAGNKSLLKIL